MSEYDTANPKASGVRRENSGQLVPESEAEIARLLTERGRNLLNAPRQPIAFTKDPEADKLLNDIEAFPHAFILGCLMDRQIGAAKAWHIPRDFAVALGGFSIEILGDLSPSRAIEIMTGPPRLHRFPSTMGTLLHAAIRRIIDVHEGDAARIWSGTPPSAEVVYRFLQFDGIGPKIATMAANILAREFKVKFRDYNSIDISADVQVRRVFGRLGLCSRDAPTEEIAYKARSLNAEYPGMLDQPCWEIGRNWCRPQRPYCAECYLRPHCRVAKDILKNTS